MAVPTMGVYVSVLLIHISEIESNPHIGHLMLSKVLEEVEDIKNFFWMCLQGLGDNQVQIPGGLDKFS